MNESFDPPSPSPRPVTPERRRGVGTAGSDYIDVLQVVSALWQGKWRILFWMVLALIAGGIYVFQLAQPRFAATAWLALQVNTQQVVDIESVVSGISTESEAINTELDVIKSLELIQKLVRDLDLLEDLEFNPHLTEPPLVSIETAHAFAVDQLGLPLAPLPIPDAREIELDVVDAVREAISVSAKPGTYLYSITLRTQDPDKSVAMANQLAQIYLEDQIDIKFAATEFAVNWLAGRVSALEADLNSNEDKIKDLRAETELVSLEALEVLNIRAKDLRQRLEAATNTIETLQTCAATVANLAEQGLFRAIATEYDDAQLLQIAPTAQRGDDSSLTRFQARLETLRQRDTTDQQRAMAQRNTLQLSYDRILTQIEEQNADLLQLNQFLRETDATKVLYETFLARLKETSVQVGLQRADSRILSQAVRGKQVAPRRNMILGVSVLLGALLGASLALLRQQHNRGFRSVQELEQVTGYGVLGQIPMIPIKRRVHLLDYLRTKTTSAATEAVRNLRTSVTLLETDRAPQIILSTSSIPGEGKTTQSISLAHNFSGLGKKVLLVEADIRRRTFEEYFKAAGSGDLVSVINGDMALEQAVLQDPKLKIDVLMGGKPGINAADLFSSERFKAFITTLRETYDYVIIDTPPVLVVSDARIIARHVDAIVYSVKWNSTNQRQVIEGLHQLRGAGPAKAGLVLSQLDLRRMKRYGQSYGAYQGYGQGYYD